MENLLENAFLRASQAATHRSAAGVYGKQLIPVQAFAVHISAFRRVFPGVLGPDRLGAGLLLGGAKMGEPPKPVYC